MNNNKDRVSSVKIDDSFDTREPTPIFSPGQAYLYLHTCFFDITFNMQQISLILAYSRSIAIRILRPDAPDLAVNGWRNHKGNVHVSWIPKNSLFLDRRIRTDCLVAINANSRIGLSYVYSLGTECPLFMKLKIGSGVC